MKQINPALFGELVQAARQNGVISRRLAGELRAPASDTDWSMRELLAVTTRGNEGILLIALDEAIYLTAFTLVQRLTNHATGRSQPIICDLCKTWQGGDNSGSITFRLDRQRTVTYLCCSDLDCSLHVRNLTPQGARARTQVREDITSEQRVQRLRDRLAEILTIVPSVKAG